MPTYRLDKGLIDVSGLKPASFEEAHVRSDARVPEQGGMIARLVSSSRSIEELYPRTLDIEDKTLIYRAVRLIEDPIIEQGEFCDGHSRYERLREQNYDHLLNLASGKTVKFRSEKAARFAQRFGYQLIDCWFKLYTLSLDKEEKKL
jgi:Fe2+ or Zn2+ uptake regulation protein